MDNLERNVENGSLYCLDNNFELTKVDNKYMITNGPAFIDAKNFFHTDSRKKIIYKIKIDNNLNIKRKKIFKKFSKSNGSPDGMTIDKYKNLWVKKSVEYKSCRIDKTGNYCAGSSPGTAGYCYGTHYP